VFLKVIEVFDLQKISEWHNEQRVKENAKNERKLRRHEIKTIEVK
jgi:hypothetical protein